MTASCAAAARAAKPALAAGSERKRLLVAWRLVELPLVQLASKRKRLMLVKLIILRWLLVELLLLRRLLVQLSLLLQLASE
jgi:hypothetical protein